MVDFIIPNFCHAFVNFCFHRKHLDNNLNWDKGFSIDLLPYETVSFVVYRLDSQQTVQESKDLSNLNPNNIFPAVLTLASIMITL